MSIMSRPQFMPQPLSSQSQVTASTSSAQLEEQFKFLEELNPVTRQVDVPVEQIKQDPAQTKREADDLARTAALLVETVKDEQNPKFKNSQFMRLMRGLRDGEVVVDGNDMVERNVSANDGVTDVKGKGKERATGEPQSAVLAERRKLN